MSFGSSPNDLSCFLRHSAQQWAQKDVIGAAHHAVMAGFTDLTGEIVNALQSDSDTIRGPVSRLQTVESHRIGDGSVGIIVAQSHL